MVKREDKAQYEPITLKLVRIWTLNAFLIKGSE